MCGGTEHEHHGLAAEAPEYPPTADAVHERVSVGPEALHGDNGRTPSTVEHRGKGATVRGFPAPGCGVVRKP